MNGEEIPRKAIEKGWLLDSLPECKKRGNG